MSGDALLAGVGRSLITPALGTRLVGSAGRATGCTSVHDDLMATALVLQFCWGAAPLPHVAPDAKIRAQTFTDRWNMTSGMSQEDQELAWTLIKFLVSPEEAKKVMETTGTPPEQTKLMHEYFSIYGKCQAPDTVEEVFQGVFTHGIPGSGFKIVGWDQLLQIWANVTDSYFSDPGANTTSMVKDLEDQTTAKLKQIKTRYKK